jgi:nucleoside-diphosphate-sugar epimerase
VISLFIEALVQGRAPEVHGDGKQTRDFTFVGDVVRGVLACCEAKGVAGEAINLATGGRVSLVGLLDSLQRIVGARVPPIFNAARDGDVRDSQADISKARRLLGYEPLVAFEDGLRETVAWYQTAQGSGLRA